MATLMEGREIGLASNAASQENKTVVHFKLTDTALKTLEDFAKAKNTRATIQFQGSDGFIKIPSHGNLPDRIFQISLSALPGDLNASFECIQQTCKLGESKLLSVGTMQNRVTVLATDDVFDRTKAKMSKVEEENKKVCTKEIVPSGRHISKKIQKILPAGSLQRSHLVKKVSSVRKLDGPVAGVRDLILRSSPSPSTGSSAPSQGQNRHSPAATNNLTASKPASIPSRVLTSSTSKQSSVNMPYRDRIIHLLALKPYKKPELYLKLQKDGVIEQDKNSLGSILQQVATLNRDNSYTLAKSAWAEVRQDWPLYTDQDRTLLNKNLQQESRVTPTSPAVSPASSNPDSPGNSQKRAPQESEGFSNPNKKKRISHMDKRQDEMDQPSKVKPSFVQQSSPTSNRENLDGSVDELGDDKPDFLRKFVQIENSEQRGQYKQEFNKEYAEYRNLHQQVDIVAHRFRNLRTQISQTEEGSPDFEVLKKEVLQEYEAQKSDPKFLDNKQRMEYLHQKLSHIKRLIQEYDQRVRPQPGS